MKKSKNLEEEYFVNESASSRHKLQHEKIKKNKKAHDEELKALHYMKCPKCGHDLETKRISYVDVDQCSSCGVIVLEPDNVERFIAEERSVLKSLIDFFK
ncbi:MAG: zf-TFIIB domain-containing protein [Myxococcales bacterium]|nr:MAG: zf-TFIIB domain-containing protein [Myxococcales bacterium]